MSDKLTKFEEEMIDVIANYTSETRDKAEGVTGWGGKRSGAGRPSTGRSKKIIYVTDAEYTEVKKLIDKLRE